MEILYANCAFDSSYLGALCSVLREGWVGAGLTGSQNMTCATGQRIEREGATPPKTGRGKGATLPVEELSALKELQEPTIFAFIMPPVTPPNLDFFTENPKEPLYRHRGAICLHRTQVRV